MKFCYKSFKKIEIIYNKKILYFNLLFRASEVGELEFDQKLGANSTCNLIPKQYSTILLNDWITFNFFLINKEKS